LYVDAYNENFGPNQDESGLVQSAMNEYHELGNN
jgi:hypothetical protein